MGIAERHSLPDQVIGCVSGIGKALLCRSRHPFFIEGRRGKHAGHKLQAAVDRVDRVKCQLLVLLHILVVGKRNRFHGNQQGSQGSVHAARLAANELRDVRVLFLRHNAAACRIRIVQFDKPVFIGIPDNDFLGQTA